METTEARAKVYDILKGFSTAMFVTIGPSGRPESRPMQLARVDDEDGDVWFFTGRGGTLAEEVKEESVVLLVFQNDTSAYLSLRGKARVNALPEQVDPPRIHAAREMRRPDRTL